MVSGAVYQYLGAFSLNCRSRLHNGCGHEFPMLGAGLLIGFSTGLDLSAASGE